RQEHPPSEDQAVHPAAQWKGRALPENPGRGTALCPKFQQRGGPLVRDLCLEHPLQLPPPAQRRRGLATSISSPGGCHYRPALIHLDIPDPPPASRMMSARCPETLVKHLRLHHTEIPTRGGSTMCGRFTLALDLGNRNHGRHRAGSFSAS